MPLFDYPQAPVYPSDLEAFLVGAQAVVDAHYARTSPSLAFKLEMVPLKHNSQFAKFIEVYAGQHRAVWAFVRLSDGLIFKPSSWSVPAKHPRGSIHTASHGAEYLQWTGPRYVKDLIP